MGYFQGRLELYELEGRNGEWFALLADLTFIDDDGTSYTAPAGTLTDFASVPRPVWWLLPKYGKHTRAAVIHDDGCTRRYMDSASVHALFRRALKACGCAPQTVYGMWLMVRLFGPRFKAAP